MKYGWVIVIIILLAFAGYSYVGSERESKQIKSEHITASPTTEQKWEKVTDEQGPILISVTPEEIGGSAKQWRFTVEFTTHSGALEMDPMKVITLEDGKGNSSMPTSWEGAGPGGHHRAGVIIFNAVESLPQSVSLIIKNVGGISERSFSWNVK